MPAAPKHTHVSPAAVLLMPPTHQCLAPALMTARVPQLWEMNEQTNGLGPCSCRASPPCEHGTRNAATLFLDPRCNAFLHVTPLPLCAGDNTIAMSNLCRDESCMVLEDKIESVFGSSFSIRGLGGVLTCGVTGARLLMEGCALPGSLIEYAVPSGRARLGESCFARYRYLYLACTYSRNQSTGCWASTSASLLCLHHGSHPALFHPHSTCLRMQASRPGSATRPCARKARSATSSSPFPILALTQTAVSTVGPWSFAASSCEPPVPELSAPRLPWPGQPWVQSVLNQLYLSMPVFTRLKAGCPPSLTACLPWDMQAWAKSPAPTAPALPLHAEPWRL